MTEKQTCQKSKHADEVHRKECTSENTQAPAKIHAICRKNIQIQVLF